MSNVVAVIPARMASTRFPRKMVQDRTGQPLIRHVIDQVRKAKRISSVLVATDHVDIAKACEFSGAQVFMTRESHPNGTSRIAEVIQTILATRPDHEHPDIVVNVQGDEPEIDPGVIDQLVMGLEHDPDAPMATLASPFGEGEDPTNPNIVKLILNQRGRAIYFSRSLIPFDRDKKGPAVVTYYKHPGLYAYRTQFLLTYASLPPTPLEQIEQLEQLRAIEHGYPIAVIKTVTRHVGIDTAEQYDDFVRRYRPSK